MKLIRWTYSGRGRIRAYFDVFPFSTVVLRRIRNFYFVEYVLWEKADPIVHSNDLEVMEKLINDELKVLDEYLTRKTKR
ncbi:hypothetical protein KP78_28710 [Jeotgalibacillus soli]|uniref:Uncharacterized protein n=2 Tax=Jeotgalibacillus soli TaxID=889306 RepID=A0A0C2V8P1_9BACL|nr:hypothetical protein KP78_28710 [Jeotgalibacillus soli]